MLGPREPAAERCVRPSGEPAMNHAEQEQQRSRNRAAPVWSAIAPSAPFLGFACGLVAGVSAPHFQWFEWGFRVWLGFGVAGLLAGVIAIVRAERLWGLTLAGLILSTVLVFLLVAWFITRNPSFNHNTESIASRTWSRYVAVASFRNRTLVTVRRSNRSSIRPGDGRTTNAWGCHAPCHLPVFLRDPSCPWWMNLCRKW